MSFEIHWITRERDEVSKQKFIERKRDVDDVVHKMEGQRELDNCRRLRRIDGNKARLSPVTLKPVWHRQLCFFLAFQNKLY